MFYKNLFKGIAAMAMFMLMTSCGGLKTDEVTLDDCIKIPAQDIELSVKDYGEDYGVGLESRLTVEALTDIDRVLARVDMILIDEDGVDLIRLIAGTDIPKNKGQKKKCDFGNTLGDSDKTKEEFKEIIKKTKSVRFEGEDLKWLNTTKEVINSTIEIINKSAKHIENAVREVDDLLMDIDIYDEF